MGDQKVLIILNDLSGGGAERIFVNIANEFAAQGVEVAFLLGRKQGVYFDILQEKIPVYELQAFNLYQYIRKLRAFLKDATYTHIFTASDYISVAAILAKRKLRLAARIIATLHYNLPYQLSILPLPQRIWLKYLNRHYMIKADELVAVSHGVAEGFVKIAGRKKAPEVKVIYNPVFDDSIYDKAGETVPETFFNTGKTTLINIGRLEIQKNHRRLIEAFSLLLQKKKDIQLLIIGRGALEEEIKKLVKEKGLEEHIIMAGFKQNPFAYLAKSDLFVLSSDYEGLPTVLIESLALGINVASTDCPSGPDEILEQGKYGWLAADNQPASLATAMEKAISQRHPASFLQERARLFHKKNIIPQYLKLIN